MPRCRAEVLQWYVIIPPARPPRPNHSAPSASRDGATRYRSRRDGPGLDRLETIEAPASAIDSTERRVPA